MPHATPVIALPMNRSDTFKGCGTAHRIAQPMTNGTEIRISDFLRPNSSSTAPIRRFPAICDTDRMLAVTEKFVQHVKVTFHVGSIFFV
jgi:hypothetical protein